MDESLVEFKFLGVAIFVELEYEVRVEVERDADPFDDLLQNFESALGLNNSGLPQGLLQVVYYLDVSLLSLLDVLALPGLHSVTTARKIYKRTSHPLLIIYDFFKQMAEKVTLLVYDITRGMAKGMSMMMIGQQVDAIYHTSIVVYGREVFLLWASMARNHPSLLRKTHPGDPHRRDRDPAGCFRGLPEVGGPQVRSREIDPDQP